MIYRAKITKTSSVERQKGLTSSNWHTQLDPFASKLMTCAHITRETTTVFLYLCSMNTDLAKIFDETDSLDI